MRLLRRCLFFLCVGFYARGALFTHFAYGDQNESSECNRQQRKSRPAMQLRNIAVEESQADKDKKDMRAEDVQRCLAEGEKRLDRYSSQYVFAQPVANNREGEHV